MKGTIAVFHCFAGPQCASACGEGLTTTLARMGYNVIDCGRPPKRRIGLDVLKKADLIILGALEHYWYLIAHDYGAEWAKLTMPKAAWYAESAHRDDLDFDFEALKWFADRHYYAAVQDADEFGGTWLPFGVDTKVFRPVLVDHVCSAAFIGTLYPKRQDFLRKLTFDLTPLCPTYHSDIHVYLENLVESYCASDISVNLPAYSRLLVTKVTEAMACGRMLITPAMDHPSAIGNMAQFEDGKHLVYYDPMHPKALGDIVEHYNEHPEERDAIAAAGMAEVRRAHTLEHRLQTMLSDAGIA